jgi:hypothetical protein
MYQLLILNLTVTASLCGLIWVIQLVHYPLFSYVSKDRYSEFQSAHMSRITYIVAPLMLLEGGLGVLLVFYPDMFYSMIPVSAEETRFNILSLLLIIVVWLSTLLIQMPCHARLERGFKLSVHQHLVRGNWIRTVAWSLKLTILVIDYFLQFQYF